ncbi:unnamed protein product [Arabidopsis halleri]
MWVLINLCTSLVVRLSLLIVSSLGFFHYCILWLHKRRKNVRLIRDISLGVRYKIFQ